MVINANGEALLSFDVANEVFEMTPLPNCCVYEKNIHWNLTVLKGSVALIANDITKTWRCFDIWLLEKHVENCWVKHSTIEPLDAFRVLGFWLNGEEFLMNSTGKELLSYDPKSQVIRDLQADYGLPRGFSFSAHFLLYTESLISLKTRNELLQ